MIEVPAGTTILNAARKIGGGRCSSRNVLLQQVAGKWG